MLALLSQILLDSRKMMRVCFICIRFLELVIIYQILVIHLLFNLISLWKSNGGGVFFRISMLQLNEKVNVAQPE